MRFQFKHEKPTLVAETNCCRQSLAMAMEGGGLHYT